MVAEIPTQSVLSSHNIKDLLPEILHNYILQVHTSPGAINILSTTPRHLEGSTIDTMEDSPLGRLPGELRNQIYELVLTLDEPLSIRAADNCHRFHFQLPYTKRYTNALLRVCKQARRECAGFFYDNTFHLIYPGFMRSGGGYNMLDWFSRTVSAVDGAKSVKEVVIVSTLVDASPQHIGNLLLSVRSACQSMAHISRAPTDITQLTWELVVMRRHGENLKLDLDVREFGKRPHADLNKSIQCYSWGSQS